MLKQPPHLRKQMQSPGDAVAEQDSNAAGSQSHTYRALSALESLPGVRQKEKMQQKPPTAALEELRILGFQT